MSNIKCQITLSKRYDNFKLNCQMFHCNICVTNHYQNSPNFKTAILHLKRHKIEKIMYDISFIRHFVALYSSRHFSQARRALNPWLLQNASCETSIRIYRETLLTFRVLMFNRFNLKEMKYVLENNTILLTIMENVQSVFPRLEYNC
jgi:hypothetical protein